MSVFERSTEQEAGPLEEKKNETFSVKREDVKLLYVNVGKRVAMVLLNLLMLYLKL